MLDQYVHHTQEAYLTQKVSEYDQEIPQSRTADQWHCELQKLIKALSCIQFPNS